MKKVLPVVLLVTMAGLMMSCKKNMVADVHLANPGARYKVLIAATESEFKKPIREKFIDQYRAYCDIEVISLKKLKDKPQDDYHLILVMDEVQAWLWFNKRVKKFVKKIKDPSRVVLLMTSGDPDWKYPDPDVDAITSASEKEKAGAVTEAILHRAGAVLKPPAEQEKGEAQNEIPAEEK